MKLFNNNIYEDKYSQKEENAEIRKDLMTEEEIKRCDFYINRYSELKSEKNTLEAEWIEIQNAFKSYRDDETSKDDSFVNGITPNIEGQLASMTERNVKATIDGKGVSDESFAKVLEPVADAIFRENKIRRKLKDFGRKYLLYGNAYFIVDWDKKLSIEGMPKIKVPLLPNVLIDDKIKNFDNIDEAEYVIEEIGSKSIIWARRKYGDELADLLTKGQEMGMGASSTHGDTESFVFLKVWTKNNEQENLQLIEMSTTGILLNESNPSTPYYTKVNNKYPVFAIDLYPIENEIHGFGDGKLLLPIQKLINRLYDEIILAIKFSSQGRTYTDPNGRLNPTEFAENDPSKPIIINNPSQFVKTERGVGINSVVFSVLEQLFAKVQEVTRFSALMTGQDAGGSMTATQSNIQMQQGNTGVTDKQTDISRVLSDVLEYALGLTIQFWNVEQAFRIANVEDDTKREYAWVNPKQFKNIPVIVPSTKEYKNNYLAKNEDGKAPETMVLTDKDGKDITKNIELDVDVKIGEGMPNNKTAMYNMVLSLSQLQLMDTATGQPRSLFTFSQVKEMMEEILGIRIKEDESGMSANMPNGQNIPLNQNANVAGNSSNGQALSPN